MLAFQGFFNRLQRNYESEEKVAQPCSPLCDPMDYKVRGILQARILQWVAFPFSDLPNPGIEPRSSALQADSLPAEPQGKPQRNHKKTGTFHIISSHIFLFLGAESFCNKKRMGCYPHFMDVVTEPAMLCVQEAGTVLHCTQRSTVFSGGMCYL